MTEPKDLVLINEQLRRSNRRWKALALAACAFLGIVACFSVVAAARAQRQALAAVRAERQARDAALIAAKAAKAANPGQPR
jgi:hypothetical protein